MEILRYESALGRTDVAHRPPHPALRPYVTRYWSYVERMAAPMRRRELPSSEVVLVLNLGPKLVLDGESHASFVAGLTESSVVTEMDGESDGVQVNLTPLGAYLLLGVPMHTVTNRCVALDGVLGRLTDELLERLYDAAPAERFDLLDALFLERIARAAPPTPSVVWSWRRLVATDGRLPVRELTHELGCSRKHLAVGFREQIGLTPKTAARLLRFQRAIRLIDGKASSSWGDIAADCGYYDQAHFNRDFRQFAGSTPTEFVGRRYPDGLGLSPE